MSAAARPDRGWRSYDAVADAYVRVSAACHRQLACDLVAAVAPPFGARVLDLGAGSGIAAAAALDATGAGGHVVALDPSAVLVAHARAHHVDAVAGAAPGLPFRDRAFDVAVASLVIGHFDAYQPALADLVRVLRPGGRLGLTTWGRLDDAPPIDDADERAAHATWDAVVGEYIDLDAVDEAAAEALPWEEWFGDPARIRLALAEVGLRVVDMFGRAYRYPLGHAEWLQRVATGARARYVRATLGAARFAAVEAEVLATLDARAIPDPVRCADEAIVTIAAAPTGRVMTR
ncbi:MAG: methyltransferase domain-containing protein [Actinobacteria bacterium]|nr:methyltransferase domain-containing protein [Actinomycetota bacterium]